MKKNLFFCFLLFLSFNLHAADYYWVGGGGNWTDINHWRLGSSSGGTASIVPAAGDNVFFGAYSGFTSASKTVTIDANAFCNNMTWESGVAASPTFTRGASTAILLSVSGNLTLAPTVSYVGIYANLVGVASATLTTNGPVLGSLNMTINKPGSGLSLADDLIYTSPGNALNSVILTAGSFNAAGRTMTLYGFSSSTGNTRSVDISNGKVTVSLIWDYRGANKTLTATGAFISSGTQFYADAGSYPKVEAGGSSSTHFAISNTTLNKLTFTNTSLSSQARIANNNVIDTLLFKGAGSVSSGSNQIKRVVFSAAGTIGGAGNIIQYSEFQGEMALAGQGNHVIDTLITAPNKNIVISGSNTINKYFKAGGLPCDGFTEISGVATGTLTFVAGAVVDINNVLLSNMTAKGPNTPIAVNGIDNGGNLGFTVTAPAGPGTTLYWVGGAGDWNNKTHWSTSSGGTGGACIPFASDNVIFDANSGFSAGNNVVATSSNTYCKDMTWGAGITGNPVFNESGTYSLFVYGSIVLNPTVTMNAFMELRGETGVTLRTNGSSLGVSQYNIYKSFSDATTGLTLLDDWTNLGSAFVLTRGVLDIRNRKVNIYSMTSNGSLERSIYMNKANVSVTNWSYFGSNNILDATDSYLLARTSITTRIHTYNIIDCASTAAGSMDIANTTIGQLTFTNTSLTSGARIAAGNIIRRLEFKGQGAIVNPGGNVIDSLITAENRNFFFTQTSPGNTTINKYFKATHPSCSGLGEIRSGTSDVSTIVFGANAKVDISNVYLERIAATGGGGTLTLPIPFTGADAGGNSGWTISTGAGSSARYWVGGGGDWNDASHWSTSSGGTGGSCIPTVNDDVYFDANSGFGTTVPSKTVTVNNGNAYLHNMSWAGVLNEPVFSKSSTWAMECWGNKIVLNPNSTLNIASLLLKGSEPTVMSGQSKGGFDIQISKPGAGLTLSNDYDNVQTDFYLVEGAFSTAGHQVNARSIDNGGLDNLIALDISNSTINVAEAGIRYSGGTTKRTLNAANSIINGNLIADGFNYNIVNVAATTSGSVVISNTTIKELTFTNPSTVSAIGINGANNTIGRLEYKGSGGIYGTGNKIETLIFFPGDIYTITSGTNTTITGGWFGSGSPCRPTEIKSSGAAPATITKASGAIDFDYVRLQRIVATGGATFNAREHTTDLGGNTGWSIAPYNGAAPILGLGPDLGLKNSELPYTIKTDGFFGSPLSLYEWKKDGNVISTDKELVVTEPGTYSVKVNFPDGCAITDEIVVTLVNTDLAIEKTVDNSSPAVGNNVVFTVKVTNNGPGAGSGITVTDQLPTGYTYVSDTAHAGTVYDAVTGLWTIGNLASGADATITITAKVNATGIYVNTAAITSAAEDPDTNNNSATVSLVPNATFMVTQPSCAVETGSIEIPLIAGGTYSINGGTTFVAGNVFADLAAADYAVVVKVGASISAPVTVTINEAPAAPDAPVSGGNQSVCVTNPIQTLTATATVPAGSTITWYDAPNGGNVIANPILNVTGTVAYYAETNNGTCTSKSRTPVILSINPSPLIDALTDQSVCASYTLPTITGTNLTGNQAYYTQPNGGGLKYLAGATLNTVGTQTLYLFDKAVTSTFCAGDITVTPNTSLSNDVLLHQILNPAHNFYQGSINPDFWKGLGSQSVTYSPSEGSERYLNVIGDFNISSNPVCTSNLVTITAGATFKNEGPAAGVIYSGHITIINKLTAGIIVTQPIQYDTKVGVSSSYTVTSVVSASDLLAGNLIVVLGVETSQNGYKNWTLSNFKATYQYLSETPCPDEKSFQLTINAIPAAPVNSGNQEVCAANPVQTLTAAATVPAGTTITWYDALTGGNIVPAPTLNTVGTVIYYAEAVSNTCVSATRTPVTLTINQSPVINAIADINACGPFTLPAITGTNLSGNQAYYTGINKTGAKYSPGDVLSAPGETRLYAYDEILVGAGQNPVEGLTLTNITNLAGGYTSAQLQALWPDQTHGFPRLGTLSGNPAVASSFLSFAIGSPAGAKFSAVVGRLTLPAGYTNAGDQVLVSVGNGFTRNSSFPPVAVPGYAGQIAIMNTATNQLLYQTSFNDVPTTGITPSVAGLVPAADMIAGNIGVYIEFGHNAWRVTGLTAKYQFVSGGAGCPAQQSFKVNVNAIPAAPVANNQTACADSPVQTLTATATVPTGSTIVWYDAATAGNVVSTPILNAAGTITYYAETHTGTCVSATRTPVVLTINAQPVLSIHNPAIVCHPGTINLTAAAVTTGSTAGLQFAYFTDAAATVALSTPAAVAISGTYYIKGTNALTGCSIVAPVVVQFVDKPEVTAVHPDCVSGTGSINITSPLGAGFEYSIDNGANYQTAIAFTNLTAGTYNVRAKNTLVPGCESDPNVIVINATPTTAMPLVLQPDCDQAEGSIEFPVNAAYEYSIDNGPFTGGNVFTGLNVGPHSIRSKKAGDACVADPVTITIVANGGRPDAPTTANQVVCATSPVQTLTAVATVPGGTTLKWYDAETGGNLVSSPTLNTIGSVVYYAESNTATCTSTTRMPARLTITSAPVFDVIADKNVCGPLTLPVIAGTDLSGNQAYYTASNGGGTKYNPGDVFSTAGETTLYAYDNATIASIINPEFALAPAPNTGYTIANMAGLFPDNSRGLGLVPGSNNMGSPTASTTVDNFVAGTPTPTPQFSVLIGKLSMPSGYTNAGSRVMVSVGGLIESPLTVSGYAGQLAIMNTATNQLLYQTSFSDISIFGVTPSVSGLVPASDLIAGNISAYIEFKGPSWTISNLSAKGRFFSDNTSCPAETSFKIVVRNTTAGSITADQTICKNTAPVALASVTDGTGSGSIKYRWESSVGDATTGFNVIAGATLATYAPAALNTSTWFRRITISSYNGLECESDPTVAVKITVQDALTAGTISASQTICNNSSPAAFTSVTNATGSGTISYRWESSTTDAATNFTAISGIVSADYTPAALTATTWFRRIAISTDGASTCESVPTAAVQVRVQDAVAAGAISTDQTVCDNTTAALTSVTAGIGSGIISYRWESSTTSASAGFAGISGATLASYTPAALNSTTWFRRITISTLDGIACESAPTAATAITVQDQVTAGTIGADQTICANAIPAALASVTAGTGSGTISYRWEQSSASAPAFAAVTGVTSAGYTPGALTETTWFRRITISSLNGVLCESMPTAPLKITVQEVVTGGTIGADQTVCNGSVPAALTSVTAGSGSGTITYRWESSVIDALTGFASVPGATIASFTPAALSSTTYFRRITISTLNGKACESAPTAVVTITVQDAVTAGTIGADQIICNNTVPAALSSVTAGTGSGTISYRWERSSFATTGFAAIPGATAATYSPAALTTSFYFRRVTISTQNGVSCESVPTPVVKITVQGATTAGTISTDQTICGNTAPATLTSTVNGSGSGTISYRWEGSTVGAASNFAAIAGANSADYAPVALTSTTWFRRITISTQDGLACESAPSSVVTIRVQNVVTAGVIATDQTICNNTVPAAITSATAGTGSGTISYRWESSAIGATTGFTAVPGAELADYAVPALTSTTWFRRITISTQDGLACESAPSSVVTIRVQDVVTAGAIATDQAICNNTAPAAITSATAGTGSGTISYRWESSASGASTDFTAIAGANSAGYAPVALTSTTWFRRITISTQDGLACESAPSSVVTVTVQDVVTAGAIATDQTICNNTAPAAITSATEGTASGTISYRWESSTTGAATGFIAMAGAELADYAAPALTSTTWFRRITISTQDEKICESVPTPAVKITVVPELLADAGDDQQSYNSGTFTLAANVPNAGTGKWTVVSGTLAEAMADDTNPAATVKLLPNTTVTLRWTVSEATCSVSDEVILTYDAQADVRTVKTTKTAGKTTFVPGEAVVYTIRVTNNGPSDAAMVNIKDTAPTGTTISSWTAAVTSGAVTLPGTSGSGNLNETLVNLPNGATVTYEVTVQTPAGFINNLVNSVQVTGITPDPDPVCITCQTIPLSPDINAALKLWKNDTYEDTNGDGKVNQGDRIRYTFKVQNTGNVPVSNITINDTKVAVTGSLVSLAAGATDESTFSVVYTITQADMDKGGVYNLATVKGKNPAGADVTAESVDPAPLDPTDPANPPVSGDCPTCTITPLRAIPSVTLVKTVINTGTGANGTFQLGDDIQYRFVITNTGNVTLNNIVLNDPLISTQVINIPGSLAPGAFAGHTATYKILRTDADKGNVVNQATVTAKDPSGKNADDTSGTAADNNDATQTIIANVPPIATDDESLAESGKPVMIKVKDNDLPGTVPLDPSGIEIIADPLHGSVIKNPDGTITYTSAKGYTGTDAFTYRVKDEKGNWSNVATVKIIMRANALLIPNVFTPNGDGRNDKFEITGLEAYGNANLLIFNRWGNEVYKNGNYKNEWDALGLNEGTYYYILNLKQGDKTEVHKGWILIKR